MNFLRKILVTTLILLLPGCQTFLNLKTSKEELISAKEIEKEARLLIEITSCISSKDSRYESSTLSDLKKNIPSIFTGSKYIDCYTKNYDTFAVFSIPYIISTSVDKNKYFNSLVIYNENNSLDIYLGSNLKNSLNDYFKDNIYANLNDIKIIINYSDNNDIKIFSSYLFNNDRLYPMIDKKINVNNSINIIISEISLKDLLINQNIKILEFIQ